MHGNTTEDVRIGVLSLCTALSPPRLCVCLSVRLFVPVSHRTYTHTDTIIMYIYHALIYALSAYMIHINLNIIFCTHVEHSPTKTVYIKYYTHTHTHTHTNALHTHTMTVAVSEEDLADSHGTQASADTILDFLEEA